MVELGICRKCWYIAIHLSKSPLGGIKLERTDERQALILINKATDVPQSPGVTEQKVVEAKTLI